MLILRDHTWIWKPWSLCNISCGLLGLNVAILPGMLESNEVDDEEEVSLVPKLSSPTASMAISSMEFAAFLS